MTVDMSRYRLGKDVQAAIDDLIAKIAELVAQVEELPPVVVVICGVALSLAGSALTLRSARYATEIVVIEIGFVDQPAGIAVRSITDPVIAVRLTGCG